MDSFYTIKTFTHPSELLVLKSRLDDEGIICLVKDEFITQVQPFYSNAIGGVKLQVREVDFLRAKELLIDLGYTPDEEYKPTTDLYDSLKSLILKFKSLIKKS